MQNSCRIFWVGKSCYATTIDWAFSLLEATVEGGGEGGEGGGEGGGGSSHGEIATVSCTELTYVK